MKKQIVLLACATIVAGMVACGVSENVLNDADKRIKELKSKGVPDSLISQPLVYLYKARESNRIHEGGEAGKAAKLLKKELAKAEAFYQEKMAKLNPTVDSLKAIITNARRNYSGIALKRFDSLTAIADSLVRKNWLLQACSKEREIVGTIPSFDAAVSRAAALRDSIPGEWVCSQRDKSAENKDVNAVTKKVFTFEKDGKAKFVESKKGQSGPYLKEDWEFVSTGTWDMNSDTVYLTVTRFAAKRQMFERMYLEQGGKKKVWKKEPKETYDSAITDGSQNRYVSYADLKEDFEKTKKFK
jgi:hypothetical protein